jgi:hypothetical protein
VAPQGPERHRRYRGQPPKDALKGVWGLGYGPIMRQVVYEGLREDKPAAEVCREVPRAK